MGGGGGGGGDSGKMTIVLEYGDVCKYFSLGWGGYF